MNRAWQERLARGEVLVIDGGTGSELRRRGAPLSPHAWSGPAAATHTDLLREIHLDYIRAGADIITASTFGTNRFVLEAAGLAGEFERINAQALSAALRARDISAKDVAIAGSISCLPPSFDTGAYPERDRERAGYAELADFLADNGADLIVLEMMQETEHAPRAIEAARRTGLPVWLGLSCRIDASHALVAYDFPDLSLREVLPALLSFEPDAALIMHSPPQAIAPALAELERRWDGIVGAYPEVTDGPPLSLDRWRALTAQWIEAGARLVGGCCGTRPAHIRVLRELVSCRRRGRLP